MNTLITNGSVEESLKNAIGFDIYKIFLDPLLDSGSNGDFIIYTLQLLPLLTLFCLLIFNLSAFDAWKLSFYISLFNLVHSTQLLNYFDNTFTGYQFLISIKGHLQGIDGISLWLIWLTNLQMPILYLQSYKSVKIMQKQFLYSLILLNLLSLLVFLVLDLVLFFISFEAILIPMFYLIGYYGSRNKKLSAQYQFFLYTLFGSLFLFIAITLLYVYSGTTDYLLIVTNTYDRSTQLILFLCFFISFAIKIPITPFHIWLPLAHTEGNTTASVILAAILLKLGTYGLLRFNIPLFPEACEYFQPLVILQCIISIVYSCVSALSLIDQKQVIAYSSIAHMNVSIIGLFSNNQHGLQGSYSYSISHGLVSGGQFILVGMIYDRYHTRTLKYYRGLVLIMPMYVTLFLVFSQANLSFPGTFGFISEFQIYYGSQQMNPIVTIFISSVSFLQPIYFQWTYHKIAYGSFSNYQPVSHSDITRKEINLLLPLQFWIVYLGIYPNIITDNLLYSLFNVL